MKKFDVYIEDSGLDVDDHLVMIQFSAIKSQFDHDSDRIELSVKEKSMKFKLELELQTHSQHYCKDKAENLAKLSKPQSFPNKRVDKNFYTSTKSNIDDKQLFVCKTIGDRLVCRPISNFVTMRSDLSHFDLKEEIDPREEIKPVSVKMSTERVFGSSRRVQESREESEETLEEFQPLNFNNMNSKVAVTHRVALFGKKTKIKPDPDEIKPDIYPIPDVKPKIEKMDIDDIYSNDSQTMPTSSKKSAFIRNLVKECLMKAKLVNFEEVYRYVEDQSRTNQTKDGDFMNSDHIRINNKDIIDALNEYAVLVQGNWAVKSDIFYGDSVERECTDVTGIPINLFIDARDFLIWSFDQNESISRPDFSTSVKIPDHDVKELFNQLANFVSKTKRWELKLPKDQKFLDKFPEVVQRQATFWKVRRANQLARFQ